MHGEDQMLELGSRYRCSIALAGERSSKLYKVIVRNSLFIIGSLLPGMRGGGHDVRVPLGGVVLRMEILQVWGPNGQVLSPWPRYDNIYLILDLPFSMTLY